MRNVFKAADAGENSDNGSAPGLTRARCCLTCTRSFESLWAGERICKDCKQSSAWRAGISYGSAKSGKRS